MRVDHKRFQRTRLKKIWTDSEKIGRKIFFDHSSLVNAAILALTHGVYIVFLAALSMKTVYTPWVNAMSAAFTRIE